MSFLFATPVFTEATNKRRARMQVEIRRGLPRSGLDVACVAIPRLRPAQDEAAGRNLAGVGVARKKDDAMVVLRADCCAVHKAGRVGALFGVW